jgi:cation:H+ antiporter
MILNLFYFIAGLLFLVVGANVLVRGASNLAFSFGISPLVVGLTVVAFGTSAPEAAVSVGAVLAGTDDIAIGNVVGSNIFNVLLILGLSALITPLVVNLQLIRQEVPILIGASVLLLLLSLDGQVSWMDGSILLLLLVAYTVFLIIQSKSQIKAEQAEFDNNFNSMKTGEWDSRLPVQLGLIISGLALLVLGSDWLVSSAVEFAKALGVSDVIIALTIVSAGTSLPEVATSIAAALKGERDIAVGNVVGSCTFNIFGCLGLSAIIAMPFGLTVAPSILAFDMWVMLAVTFACLPIFLTGREIARWEGAVFLLYYASYVIYLILDTQGHDALGLYSSTMLSFVAPITIITLVVSLLNSKLGSNSNSNF